jgi:hypothetical protein
MQQVGDHSDRLLSTYTHSHLNKSSDLSHGKVQDICILVWEPVTTSSYILLPVNLEQNVLGQDFAQVGDLEPFRPFVTPAREDASKMLG